MKIRPVEAELFHAGGRADGGTDWQADKETGMMILTVAFRNFMNAPKMVPVIIAATDTM